MHVQDKAKNTVPQQVLIVDDTEINLILFGALVKKLDDCQAHVFSEARKALARLS